MAGRIRSIKPEWNESQSLASCSDAARVLSVALILLADDHGRGRAHPAYLAGPAWCYAGCDVAKAEAALAELVDVGYATLYRSGGSMYFQLPGWATHQRVDKPGKPKVPVPGPDDFRETPGKVLETLGKIRLGTEGNRREQKGREQKEDEDAESESCSPSARDVCPPVAFELADALRAHLVAEKATHELASDDTWKRKRPAWARPLAALLRSGREAERATELLAWVFGDQGGTEFRFRVDSPKALREKWDRIEVAMAKRPQPTRSPSRGGMTAEEIFAMDMDEPLMLRGGG